MEKLEHRVKGKYGDLAVTLNLKTAGFAEANPWFGQAQENIGDSANFWWEVSTEEGVKGSLNLFGGTELYGAYSFIVAQTVGHDASGLSNGLNNPGAIDTEKGYAGWRSGSLFPTLGSACTKSHFFKNALLNLMNYFLNFDSASLKTHQLLRVLLVQCRFSTF
ncbi:hypothetical protein BMR06_10745 [Methylococcaceae bacterium HT5]|nr:hypothetical protein BMR06_10745 [Methylococcaceae bacterium HT5]